MESLYEKILILIFLFCFNVSLFSMNSDDIISTDNSPSTFDITYNSNQTHATIKHIETNKN